MTLLFQQNILTGLGFLPVVMQYSGVANPQSLQCIVVARATAMGSIAPIRQGKCQGIGGLGQGVEQVHWEQFILLTYLIAYINYQLSIITY